MNFKIRLVEPASEEACLIELLPGEGHATPRNITIRLPALAARPGSAIFLDNGAGPRPLALASDTAARDDVQLRSLAAGLKVPAEMLASLNSFDRCLLSLLTLGGKKPMSTGRLAYLISDLFDDISVNFVRERLAEIRKHFEQNGVAGVLVGDNQSGYRLSA